jgi:AcrR family transcriptional regulator
MLSPLAAADPFSPLLTRSGLGTGGVPKIAEQARAARREQIIAAGLACFARAGYHTTTMADVAAQAGVSKGTPYLYFASKEALFLALHEQWDCGAMELVEAAIAALPDADRRSPRQVLHAIAAAIAAHVTAEPQTCRVLMEARALAAHEPAIAAAVQASDTATLQQLEQLITAGVSAGEWPEGTDPALAARLFTAGLYGLMAQWHLAPGSFSWDAAAAALAGGPAPHADGAAPGVGGSAGASAGTGEAAAVPVA